MNCAEVERDNIIERYFANGLADNVRLAWEEHYFGCDGCFEQFQSLSAVRAAVKEAGPPPVPERRRVPWFWGMAALTAAAAILLAVLLPRRTPRVEVAEQPVATQPAQPSIALLERLEPPPYSANVLRGTDDPAEGEFRAAMQSYSKGDFRAAAEALRPVMSRHPGSTAALYFLGICDLLNGDYEQAIPELRRIVQAGDATPYHEEAEYYLALVYMKRNQKAEALAQLQRVIDLHRDHEQMARTLAAQIGR